MKESIGESAHLSTGGSQSVARPQPPPASGPQPWRAARPGSPGPEPWEEYFQLGAERVSEQQRQLALASFEEYARNQRAHFLGYQADQDFNYTNDLAWMMAYHINNIGDPFTAGNFTLNSKAVERHVLDYYAKLWHATLPHDPKNGESYWGYLLTMGSTEGNMYGMWNARDYLSGKALVIEPTDDNGAQRLVWVQANADEHDENKYTPVAFFSEDTHYSLTKAMRVLGIKTFYELGSEKYPGQCPKSVSPTGDWPEEVPSVKGQSGRSVDGPGTIDVAALRDLVGFFAEEGYPVMLCLNFGTTFKGAYDPVEEVIDEIVPVLEKAGMLEREIEYAGKKEKRYGFWIHVDGALGAAYMPFLKMAENDPAYGDVFRQAKKTPKFDFGLKYVFSIAMSGHKWIGAPWPCGVFMTKVKYQLCPPDMPVYIGSPDTTFAGSRSGFSPLILWDFLSKHSYADQMAMICEAERLATYAETQLMELSQRLTLDLYVARTPLALTVRFRQPNEALVQKYSLSTEEFQGWTKKYAHIFLLHGVTTAMVDELVRDLAQPGAFDLAAADQRPSIARPGAGATREAERSIRRLALVPTSGRGFR